MTERFTLLSERGRGAMGVVWRARDEESGQIVALKLLRPVYADDPDYLARFGRELELARRIDSPYVVKVLGYGSREGTPYLALQYVDGPSLRERLAAHGPYAWPDARGLLAQMAAGLAAAHAAGVVHRDVKPSNILIGSDEVAKLTDFGIARGLDLTRVTGPAALLGTPAYLAPEGSADARSDLYSLGCVAYELLTGAPPFEAHTYQDVILAHVRNPPDLAKLPPEARPIVGSLLAKDPAARPQNAGELVAALAGRGSVPAMPLPRPAPVVSGATPTPHLHGRRRILASLGVLGLAALLMATALVVGAGAASRASQTATGMLAGAGRMGSLVTTAATTPASASQRMPGAALAGTSPASAAAAPQAVRSTPKITSEPARSVTLRPYASATPQRTQALTALSFVAAVGTEGHGGLTQFDGPSGVATDGKYLYVSDDYNSRIVKLRASDLSFVGAVGTQGSGPDQFDGPSGVATDGTYLYVADPDNQRIVKLRASDLSWVAAVSFSYPRGIATDGTFVYVADYNNSRIVKLRASDLSLVAAVGTGGSGPDQFNSPMGITTDGTYVYVADTFNNRIEKRLASDLSLVSAVGTLGRGPNEFNSPMGIAIDGTNLYVSDSYNNRIEKRLAADLSLVLAVGTGGSGPNQFDSPEGVVTDGTYVFVVDSHNARVVILWAGQ